MAKSDNPFVTANKRFAVALERCDAGSANIEDLIRILQRYLDGELTISDSGPVWDVSVEEKIIAVKAFLAKYAAGEEGFSEADIPSMPNVQLRRDEKVNEVLVLGVYPADKDGEPGWLRSFLWWDFFEISEKLRTKGYKKTCWSELQFKENTVRLISNYDYKPGIRWIIVDTKSYHGKSCTQAEESVMRNGEVLAGPEVLMLLAQCPEWAESWNGKNSPYPNVTALQMVYGGDWASSAFVNRWDADREVRLDAYWSDYAGSDWACPSVREC